MKKSISYLLVVVIFLFAFSYVGFAKTQSAENLSMSNTIETASPTYAENPTPSSTDSVIALLLYPHIDEAIQDYFGKPTQFALYDAKIDSMNRVDTDFAYQITITVPTFHGAHNPPYGLEIMTFTISPFGVMLNNYIHKSI